MNPTLHLVCLVFAFVCFLISGIGVAHSRLNLIGLGLAFLVLALWFV